MVKVFFLAGIVAFNLSNATPTIVTPRQKAADPICHDVHLFLARGAGDPYPGTQGPLPDAVCKGLRSCHYEDVLYVGTFDKICNSVTVGVANETNQITAYAARCPKSKLVLCGHSEVKHPARSCCHGT
jgi:acetylxylan esterase